MSFRLACACLLDVAKAGAARYFVSVSVREPKTGKPSNSLGFS